MSELAPRPWEVWHARFNYSEGHGYKFRPVIVLATRPDGLLVAMVTSTTNKLSLEHDYPIQEWEAAGLPLSPDLTVSPRFPLIIWAPLVASADSPTSMSPR